MATKSQPEPKVVKQCMCGATFFQGPFKRGELNDKAEMTVVETVYQCMGCNKVQTFEKMIDRVIPPTAVL